jgi:hypothetical protein
MADKTNIKRVVEALKDAQSTHSSVDAEKRVEDWVSAKGIDENTLDEVVSQMVEIATKQVMGAVVTTGGNPEAVAMELRQLLGAGIELGYTTCEVQLEGRFLE